MKHLNGISFFIIIILVILLVIIRYFENVFYDPLTNFFKHDYLNGNLPAMNTGMLLFNLFIRYVLNSLFSIGIIWFLFKDKAFIRFSVYFYGFAFIVLSGLFVLYISHPVLKKQLFSIFYIRRFIIQPLFLLLLIPAFYYQQKYP